MKLHIGALALGAGAVLLWAAWALMPDAATNDAAHILTAVAAARAAVRTSAILQLVGAALLAVGLAGEAADAPGTRAGAILMLLGAVGMAGDAVYHQLAYQMTAPDVARQAVLPVMTGMQTQELRPLVPLLLSFLVGAVVLGVQRRRQRIGPSWAAVALMAPVAVVALGVVGVQALGLPRRFVALGTLGAICLGLVGAAVGRVRERGVK